MTEVRAEKSHRDDVENDNERLAEADDDHFPSVVALGPVGHDFHEGGVVRAGFHGEVKEVEDDEGHDCQSAPNHNERGLGRLHGGIVGILLTRFFIFLREENGEPDVGPKAGEEADPSDPNTSTVEKFMKELRVVIEGSLSGEDEEVPGQMAGEKKNKGKASNGNDDFAANGGLGEGKQGTGRGTHGSLGHPSGRCRDTMGQL